VLPRRIASRDLQARTKIARAKHGVGWPDNTQPQPAPTRALWKAGHRGARVSTLRVRLTDFFQI
jgi:hypothetical protein